MAATCRSGTGSQFMLMRVLGLPERHCGSNRYDFFFFFSGLALVSQDHVQRHLQAYPGRCRLFDDFPSLDF